MSTERTSLQRSFPGAAAALLVLLACAPVASFAQGFAAMVTPPRFELSGTPGKTQRQVMEITNADPQAANYTMRTADWTLDEAGVVKFSDALTPGSCRPWVAIERRELTVPAGSRYRYRFEVTPPADAAGECRFAVVLEGKGETVVAGQNVKIPINGQIAVIVYVAIGDAAPQLEVVRSGVAVREGKALPVIYVRNTGNAHGRLEGFLEGTDASGRKLDFTPSGLPILAGETREIALNVAGEGDAQPLVNFPISIRGTLEWSGKSTPFEGRFTP